MKMSFCLSLLLALMLSCNTKPKHPQASLADRYSAGPETDQTIRVYADSLDKQISSFEKQQSMVFRQAEQSLYTEKFSWNGNPVIYTQYLKDEGLSEKTTRYYLKSDSLLLIREYLKRYKDQGAVFEERQIYFRNHIPFRTENRIATSFTGLQSKKFNEVKGAVSVVDFKTDLSNLDDALNTANKFEMVYDEFISTPEGDFLVLKSKIPGGYSSSITVNNKDGLIDSIEGRPMLFKDAKLNIRWTVTDDHEAVYVPVRSSVTSAKGLNR